MTGQQLKNSILQMAVQGKLVPQDPNDEPASVLLERIRKEKEQLIKDGKIKKEKNPSYIFRGADNLPYEKVGKNEPVCIADEVPFEIPESWEWVRLGKILYKLSDGTHSRPRYVASGIPFISVKDVSDGKLDFSDCKYITAEEHRELYSRCNPEYGDILLTKVGTTGIPVLVDTTNEFSLFVSVALLKFNQEMLSNEYLIYLINSPLVQKQVEKNTRGVGNKNWVMRDIANTLIVIPPLLEQKRIVSKLQEILPFVDNYAHAYSKVEELNNSFPELLKKSILQEAVQGKLVPQDLSNEPASVLLERIRAEKKRLVQEGKIKRDKHESVIYRRDNSHYERLDGIERCIDDEIPFEIPENWDWCRLGNLIESIDAGKSFKCNERPPEQNEYGIVKVSAITWGIFKQEESKTCFSVNQWIQDYAIQNGDFLICRANTAALVGGCVIVEKISKKLMLSDKVLRLRFLNSVNKLYILHILRSPFVRTQLSTAASGTSESMKNISQNTIKSLLIPFPPLEEQYRIVSKIVESLPKVMTL